LCGGREDLVEWIRTAIRFSETVAVAAWDDETMAINGSSVIPSMRYRDAHAAIDWLVRVLGFQKQAVYDGPDGTVGHAQLTLGSGMVMLGSASNAQPYPQFNARPEEIDGRVTSPIYVVVPDCQPVYDRVKAAGVEIVAELRTMDYGGGAFTVRDPEGYVWAVGEYDPWASQEAETAIGPEAA
jgi:uncharacterized glyoxalase superfamily protein PhnB